MAKIGKRLLRYLDGVLLLGSVLGFSLVGGNVCAPVFHLWSLMGGVEIGWTRGSAFLVSYVL